MEIIHGIHTAELGLYIKKEKTLVISDVHLGYEGVLEKQGVLVPRFQLKDVLDSLRRIFDRFVVERVVIAGDLKHEFGGILKQEWNDLGKFLEFLKNKKIIVVKGNHDVFLGPAVKGVKLVKEFRTGDIFIIHGDIEPEIKDKKIQTIIMGHEHPAVTLYESGRAEKFKCFLKGMYARKNLIVLPSFNPLVEGSDILKEKHLSPLLKNLKNFKVFVYDNTEKDVLEFGKVQSLFKQMA